MIHSPSQQTEGSCTTVERGHCTPGRNGSGQPASPHERLSVEHESREVGSFALRRLPLNEEQIPGVDPATSRETLWPVLPSFPRLFSLDHSDGRIFAAGNRSFARADCGEAAPGATIRMYDHYLWLTPGCSRAL